MVKITDKERLDWLLDNRDLGIRREDGYGGKYFDTRKEIDAAIRSARRQRKEK